MLQPWILTATLSGGLLLAGLDGPNLQTPPAEAKATPKLHRTDEPTLAAGPKLHVRGVVVTPDGKPVGGATVALRAKIGGQWYESGRIRNRDLLAQTRTDAAGQFAFDGVGLPLRLVNTIDHLRVDQGGAELIARADGWGMTWTDVRGLTTSEPVRLALGREVLVTGVVQDRKGRGLADLHVRVFGLTKATATMNSFLFEPGDLNLTSSEIDLRATSDAAGQFTLQHLPHDYRVGLVVPEPGFGRKVVYVDTGEPKPVTELRNTRGGSEPVPILRSPLTLSLEPQRFTRVRVIDAAGQPVRDGAVQVIDSEQHLAGHEEVAVHGEAHIAMTKPGRYRVLYAADPLKPRLGLSALVDVAAGQDSPLVELRLPEARPLTGRVIDEETGQGIVGAYVHYGQAKTPASPDVFIGAVAVSGTDGTFTIPVAFGRGRLSVRAHLFGYFVPQTRGSNGIETPGIEIDIPKAGQPEPVKLALTRGLVIRGSVHDHTGKPVPGAIVRSFVEEGLRPGPSAKTDAKGAFELSGSSPRAGVLLVAGARSGVGQTHIDGAADHPLDRVRHQQVELPLQEGVPITGRVLHQNQPRAGVVMKLYQTFKKETRLLSIPWSETKTDPQGRYRLEGLKGGDGYYVAIADPDGMVDPNWVPQMPGNSTVGPGRAEIQLPDVQLITRNQTLRGIVVDPHGKPVRDITIHARLASGRSFPVDRPGPPPTTKSDAQGRFELHQLPDLPLQLLAVRRTPAGGARQRPALVHPALNDQNIRIVLDPSLDGPIENLDAPKPSRKPRP